jgi:uncharacterized membrane protein
MAGGVAMTEIKGATSIIVQAPPHVIYDYLLDFTRHPEWVSNLRRVEQVSPGPVGVGTKFKTSEGPPPVPRLTKMKMMGGFIVGLITGAKPYSIAEITALEPGQRIAWHAGIPRGAGYFNRAEWEVVLAPHQHATRVTQRFRYLPQTAAARQMIGAAGVAGIEKACAINLERLKRIIEQRHAMS